MKILILTEDISFDGGTITLVTQLVKSLTKHHHQVTLVCCQSQKLSIPVKNTIKVIKTVKYNHHDGKIFALIWEIIKILRKIEKTDSYDLIYLWSYIPPLAYFLSNTYLHIPKILNFSGALYLEILSSFYPKKNIGIVKHLRYLLSLKMMINKYKQIQKFSLIRADKIETFSNYAKQIIQDNFSVPNHKVEIIQPGVDHQLFCPLTNDERKKVKTSLGFNINTNILLIAARLERRKGVDSAILALKQVLQKYPHTLLLIIFPAKNVSGNDSLPYHLELVSNHQLGGKVVFVTGISHHYLPPYYQMADCFLMASSNLETFGITTIEALACGTPVLGTPGPATKEILEKIDKRLVFKGYSPYQIAQGINWYLSLSSQEKTHLSQVSASYAQENYSWDKSVTRLEEIYQSLHLQSENDN